MVHDPTLEFLPLIVTQKTIVATSNYVARARGVQKMCSLSEARAACPDVIVRNGENLDPYRQVCLVDESHGQESEKLRDPPCDMEP